MAIFHLNAKTGSRAPARGSKEIRTQSAAAHCCYVARLGRYKDVGEDEVIHLESGHMPQWSTAGLKGKAESACLNYWKSADLHERANARLFKSLEFALPVELDATQQVKLARRFLSEMATTTDGRLPYTFAIHRGKGNNPHCHALLSERINDSHQRTPEIWFKRAATGSTKVEDAGAKKTKELKSKDWLGMVRERWAELANAALQSFGLVARIDHRSNAARGMSDEPGSHLGPHANAFEKRTGRRSRRGHDQHEARAPRVIAHTPEIKKIEAEIIDLKSRRRWHRPAEDLSIFNAPPIRNFEGNDRDFEDNYTPSR